MEQLILSICDIHDMKRSPGQEKKRRKERTCQTTIDAHPYFQVRKEQIENRVEIIATIAEAKA